MGKVVKSYRSISVILIHSDQDKRHKVRQAVSSLGMHDVTVTPSHERGVDLIKRRNFDLILFEAMATPAETKKFIESSIGLRTEATLLVLVSEPKVDDIFGLLQSGAHGFVALPLSPRSLELELHRAKNGPPFNQDILFASDRNAALSAMIYNNLHKVAVLMRQAREYPTAARELEARWNDLVDSVRLARVLCDGGDNALREQMIEDALKFADKPVSRLSKVRKQLQSVRDKATSSRRSGGTNALWHRIMRATSISDLGNDASRAIQAVIDALQSPSDLDRLDAVKILERLAITDAVVPLGEALSDEDERVRINATRALGRLGAEAAPALEQLAAALADNAFKVRMNAASAIGLIGEPAASTAPLLMTLLEDWHRDVRRHAADALGQLGPLASCAIDQLVTCLADPDPGVRAKAAVALGRIKADAASSSIVQLIMDDDDGVRQAAAQALEAIGTPHALTLLRRSTTTNKPT